MPTSEGDSFNAGFWLAAATVIPVLFLALAFTLNAGAILERLRIIGKGEAFIRLIKRPNSGGHRAVALFLLDGLRVPSMIVAIYATAVISTFAELAAFWALSARDENTLAYVVVWLALIMLAGALLSFALFIIYQQRSEYRARTRSPPSSDAAQDDAKA